MQRTTISLAMEFSPHGQFAELLESYRANDEEMPMHAPGLNLFEALAQGLIPSSQANSANVIAALDHMRESGLPVSWARAAGTALIAQCKPGTLRRLCQGVWTRRFLARQIALVSFGSAAPWKRLWGKRGAGQEILSEVTMVGEGQRSERDDSNRLQANLSILANMRDDGVDLSQLCSHFSINSGTSVPLLHSSATRHNVVIASWLLEAGLDPHQKISAPPGEWGRAAQIDVFDIASEIGAANPVYPLLHAWRAKQAIRSVIDAGSVASPTIAGSKR